MDRDSVKLADELSRITKDANNVMLLSLLGILALPLYLIALVYFIVYFNKRKRIRSYQSLSGILEELKGKNTKELRSIKSSSTSLEQSVAGSLLAHKTCVTILVIIGIVLIIIIGIISLYYLMGWQVV